MWFAAFWKSWVLVGDIINYKYPKKIVDRKREEKKEQVNLTTKDSENEHSFSAQ
jgi:hypothetical protein